MRKQKEIVIPKVHPNQLALNLKRGCGLDRARKIADGLYKTLKATGTEDVNTDFFKMKDIRKNERIWFQVSNILNNEKGFTLFELLFVLAIVAALCIAVLEVGVIVHFLRKFW